MEKICLPFERFALNSLQNAIMSNRNVLLNKDSGGLFYCQQGEAIVKANGKTIHIKPGDVYIYLPSSYVNIISTSPDLNGITYKTTVDKALSMLENTSYATSIMTLRENPCINLSEQQRTLLEELLDAIDQRTKLFYAQKSDVDSKAFIQLSLAKLGEIILNEIFYYFFTNQPATQPVRDSNDFICQTFMAALLQNYKQQRDIKFYAQRQSLTPRYFSTLIQRTTGRTAKQWITQITINSLKQTLLYSGKSLKEIAVDFNFPTQSLLGKYFKTNVGLSPTEFKKQEKEQYKLAMQRKTQR